MRPCQGLSFDDCPGQAVQTGTCNEGPCPVWSEWSSWDDCSADCDGGTRTRKRGCLNGAAGEADGCPGSSQDEEQCNMQSCSREMIYWNNRLVYSRSWQGIGTDVPASGDTMAERCASYCLATTDCVGMAVTKIEYDPQYYPNHQDYEYCYINKGDYYGNTDCWGTTCNPTYNYRYTQTIIQGVFRDFYDANPTYFDWEIDGVIGTNTETDGTCGETSTGFGDVNYKNTKGVAYSTADSKNVVRESGTNCAVRCFEKAGCTAFFHAEHGCTFIIGAISGEVQDTTVGESGMLDAICPSTAFSNTYTRRSQFYCLFFAPSDAGNTADALVARNTGNANTPLRVWSFEVQTNNPMVTTSQYVTVEMPNVAGNYARYRPVWFTVETHLRIGEQEPSRRRRSADRSDEFSPVDQITMESDMKLHRQAAKDAKKASKQRQIMPRTDDILADIEAIEQQAISFILDGDLELPEDVEVAATGPVETVEFVQTAADGSVTADCISGSCTCSSGFIDNGNGCEQMTVEQAATTEAPTTTQAPTDAVEDFLQSLVDKMQAVFEDNRPGRPRTHLLNKWERLRSKGVRRYNQMQANGCEFTDSWSNDSIDFDNVNTCSVSLN